MKGETALQINYNFSSVTISNPILHKFCYLGVGGVHGTSGTLSDAVGSISTAADASSLNTVLQSLTSTFGGTGQRPPPPNETSTPLDGGVHPPSFQFAAPSSAYPNIPIR